MHAARSTTTSTGRGCGLSRLVGVLTDIHGDIFALDAASAASARWVRSNFLRRRSDRDGAVRGGGDPAPQIEKNVICIKGNHERWRLSAAVGGRTCAVFSSPVISPTMSVAASTFRGRHLPGWPPLPLHWEGELKGVRVGHVARTARLGHGGHREGEDRPELRRRLLSKLMPTS